MSSPPDAVNENVIRMPGIPASPRNNAHNDQTYAARTPTDTRVSIVAAPWRRLVQAARWNGSAPHTTTGEASVNASHCQLSNCSGGIIDRRRTGSVSTAETINRCRSAVVAESSEGSGVSGVGGAGTAAV